MKVRVEKYSGYESVFFGKFDHILSELQDMDIKYEAEKLKNQSLIQRFND